MLEPTLRRRVEVGPDPEGSSVGSGRSRSRPVDGGSPRDLRAEADEINQARSSPGSFPPPTTLMLEHTPRFRLEMGV